MLPKEFLFIVPFLVYLAGYFVTQTTEDKRVAVAEDIKDEQFRLIQEEEEELPADGI